jgi:hypothetical protein
MKEAINIPCRSCKGTGLILLPVALRKTLELVRESPGLETYKLFEALAVGEDANLRITAINNRLAVLKALGLVRREGPGKNHNPYRWYPLEAK